MRQTLAIVLAFLCLLKMGCAVEKLTMEQREWLKLSSITFSHQEPHIFEVITIANSSPPKMEKFSWGEVLEEALPGGAPDPLTPRELGEMVRTQTGLEDPVPRIQRALMEEFQKQLGQIKMQEMKELHPMSDLEGLREQAKTDMLFTMKTTRWMLRFYLTSMNAYYLDYRASAQLIDLKKLNVIWSGSCAYQEDARKGAQRPWLREFLVDDGALMRTEINRAEEKCIKQLTEQLF
ncbi:MAG: hypothetical protein MRJ96_00115 [Nitrospirales bacterium]|nr:hypothetical protein [Nitrospira sp.]MDR4499845.1 hypothetical protein [Nitrospirales bacterium]